VGLGDLNSDGVPDFAVGAPHQDVRGNIDQGQVFLFSGADGQLLRSVTTPTPQEFARFGVSLAHLGDLNGDTVPDLAIGAPSPFQTAVFLVSGADGQHLRTVTNPAQQENADFGRALVGLGDVNGDGLPDLAVGAPFQKVKNRDRQGQVFLVSGATGQPLRTVNHPTPQTDAGFGYTLADMGDVDGDGFPDLAVGAPFQNGRKRAQGQVWLVSGATGQPLWTVTTPIPQESTWFGWVLESLRDVDGDGLPDLAVGVPFQKVQKRDQQGRVFLFSGATGQLLWTVTAPISQAYAGFGAALARLRDVNSDSIPDLAVGAPGESFANYTQGRVWLFSGADGQLVRTVESPIPQGGAHFGATLAGVRDLDGNGVPDLAVGAPEGRPEHVVVFGLKIRP
jgi:hypothetical protein